MNKLKNALPYVLLVSFLVFSHLKQPQLADSIIIIALCALSGYKYYLESKETPDYVQLFAQELQNQQQQLKNLQTTVGFHNIAQQNRENVNNVVW